MTNNLHDSRFLFCLLLAIVTVEFASRLVPWPERLFDLWLFLGCVALVLLVTALHIIIGLIRNLYALRRLRADEKETLSKAGKKSRQNPQR